MTIATALRCLANAKASLAQSEAYADACDGRQRLEYQGLARVYREIVGECEVTYANALAAAGVAVSP